MPKHRNVITQADLDVVAAWLKTPVDNHQEPITLPWAIKDIMDLLVWRESSESEKTTRTMARPYRLRKNNGLS